MSTGNNRFSGDPFSGNDGFSGLKTPADAVLFTVSGITVLKAYKKNLKILCKFTIFQKEKGVKSTWLSKNQVSKVFEPTISKL